MNQQQMQVLNMIQQEYNFDQIYVYHNKQEEVQPQNLSCDELETIQEEDDEFQYCSQVDKLSKTGIMFNKRVLALDQDYLCYYSKVQVYQNKKVNNQQHKPKARFLIKDIEDIVIPADKPNIIRITGFGTVIRRENKVTNSQKYSLTFRFASSQIAELWRNIIFAAKEAHKQRSYLVTFENLMKHSRSDSS